MITDIDQHIAELRAELANTTSRTERAQIKAELEAALAQKATAK